jgi:hypothetical protein
VLLRAVIWISVIHVDSDCTAHGIYFGHRETRPSQDRVCLCRINIAVCCLIVRPRPERSHVMQVGSRKKHVIIERHMVGRRENRGQGINAFGMGKAPSCMFKVLSGKSGDLAAPGSGESPGFGSSIFSAIETPDIGCAKSSSIILPVADDTFAA